jgi:heat shock protein HspQ
MMVRMRIRVIASAHLFNYMEPSGIMDVNPGLLALNTMEQYPYALDPTRAQEDRRYFQTFWSGAFVRRSFPWPEGEPPADYGRWFPDDDIRVNQKDLSMIKLEIDGRGFEILADGEPEYDYFPRNHPMRKALQTINTTAGLNMRMITQERYWERRAIHTAGDLPQQVYDIVNAAFVAANMLANIWDGHGPVPVFVPEDVTSGKMHASYINMRNHAIYARTKLMDMIALYESPSLMRKFAGLQRTDMTIRRDFDEEGHYSIMGYHGIVTTNPEYNFTSEDLNMLAEMVDREKSRWYTTSLERMGYKYNMYIMSVYEHHLFAFRQTVEQMVLPLLVAERATPTRSDFEAFRLRESNRPHQEYNWHRIRHT